MEFPSGHGHFLKLRFYLMVFRAILSTGTRLVSENLGWKSSLFLALLLSKAKEKDRLQKRLTEKSARPTLRHLAYNIFLISQRTRCCLDIVDDEMQIEISKKGITYRFTLIGVPNAAKAPFVHNLTPLTDIFFLGLYDVYDYRDGIVIDIGGYIGDTAVYFVKNGAREVYSYEPNPVNFEYLRKNVNQNGVSQRVKAFNCAVSLERRPLVVPGQAGAGSVFSESGAGTLYDIDNVSPSDLLHEREVVALMKVDCKGCEKELFDISIDEVSQKVMSLIVDAGRLDAQERAKMIARLVKVGFSLDSGPGETLYLKNRSMSQADSSWPD
jgi:FkbM family methyltransferase